MLVQTAYHPMLTLKTFPVLSKAFRDPGLGERLLPRDSRGGSVRDRSTETGGELPFILLNDVPGRIAHHHVEAAGPGCEGIGKGQVPRQSRGSS